MHFLGLDFILLSLLLFFIIFIILFLFRKKILKKYHLQKDNSIFKKNIEQYLKKTYPKFRFNFDILNSVQGDQDSTTYKYTICDDFIKQYINNRPFAIKLLHQIDTKDLWSEYSFYSKPIKDKLPPDWIKRKNAAFKRDKSLCVRCSKKLILKDSKLYIVKPINEGGLYYLENLATLCNDCNNILNEKTKNLQIQDNLYDIVIQSIK